MRAEQPKHGSLKVTAASGDGDSVDSMEKSSSMRDKNSTSRVSLCLVVLMFLLVAAAIAGGCFWRSDVHTDDDNKYSEYFPFDWEFVEKGVFVATEQPIQTVATLDLPTCMDYCQDTQARAGNFYTQVGAVPGYPRSNCFCLDSVLCVASVSDEEVHSGFAPDGVAFSTTRRDDTPTCDESYCKFSLADCS